MDYVRSNQKKVQYGMAGIGAASHLGGLMLNSMMKVDVLEIPYKGTGPALNDLVSGQFDYMVDQAVNVLPQIKSGNIKALGVSTTKRLSQLPDVPTIDEAGLKGYEVTIWNGFFAPKGTSKDIIAKLNQALVAALSDDKVKVRIIHAGVGAVNESDVLLASASNAIVIAFNVRPDRNAEEIATRERVEVRQHSVIYNVTDEMKKAMTGLLEPTFKEVRIGIAEVRNTFKVPKFGTIAGCMVTEGRITRAGDTQARLIRDHVVVYEGKIGSLRRFKDDASEVKSGFECGIGFEKFNDIKIGDMIEVFKNERVQIVA
jgi:hypothetical protein